MSASRSSTPQSYAVPSTSSERLEQALRRASDAPLRTGNELRLLKNGPATYEDWLAAIARAERWVHLENYIFENDSVGRRFADALSSKAREGVPVRVLYDWFGSADVPRSFWDELREAGAEVRAVNPPSLRRGVRSFMRRDHSKLVAVDGSYASVGGVCIADGWLERSSETGLPYRDTALAFRRAGGCGRRARLRGGVGPLRSGAATLRRTPGDR